MALNFFKSVTSSNNQIVLRQINAPSSDFSTEILNEVGTTDQAIGDVTAEIMITTPGKIPNELYYIEDTASSIQTIDQTTVSHSMTNVIYTTISANNSTASGHTTRSIVFLLPSLIGVGAAVAVEPKLKEEAGADVLAPNPVPNDILR
ncbi:hypothetical protein M0802_003663 [Mischocyttarus mexicanus]|nr:hypothetical protein M0802_003663 [Mischocyttarus mexicanus]